MNSYKQYYFNMNYEFLSETFDIAASLGFWEAIDRGASFHLVRACISGYGYI